MIPLPYQKIMNYLNLFRVIWSAKKKNVTLYFWFISPMYKTGCFQNEFNVVLERVRDLFRSALKTKHFDSSSTEIKSLLQMVLTMIFCGTNQYL